MGSAGAHAGNHVRVLGNTPRTPNGVHDATSNPKHIKAWFKDSPAANFGIATGPASGIFVLDIDGKVGKARLATSLDIRGSAGRCTA
jgi:Bifunctional DNA primase/polymerase, N-terminal